VAARGEHGKERQREFSANRKPRSMRNLRHKIKWPLLRAALGRKRLGIGTAMLLFEKWLGAWGLWQFRYTQQVRDFLSAWLLPHGRWKFRQY